MSEKSKDGKKRPRSRKPRKSEYVHRSNAVHFTIYDPEGKPLKPEAIEAVEKAVTDAALSNRALVGFART